MILTRRSLKNTRMTFWLRVQYAGVFLKYFTFMHLKMLYLNAVIMNTYFLWKNVSFFVTFTIFVKKHLDLTLANYPSTVYWLRIVDYLIIIFIRFPMKTWNWLNESDFDN